MQTVASHGTWSLGTRISSGRSSNRDRASPGALPGAWSHWENPTEKDFSVGLCAPKTHTTGAKTKDKPKPRVACSKSPSPHAPLAPCSLTSSVWQRKMKPGQHFQVCFLYFFLQIFFSTYFFFHRCPVALRGLKLCESSGFPEQLAVADATPPPALPWAQLEHFPPLWGFLFSF